MPRISAPPLFKYIASFFLLTQCINLNQVAYFQLLANSWTSQLILGHKLSGMAGLEPALSTLTGCRITFMLHANFHNHIVNSNKMEGSRPELHWLCTDYNYDAGTVLQVSSVSLSTPRLPLFQLFQSLHNFITVDRGQVILLTTHIKIIRIILFMKKF